MFKKKVYIAELIDYDSETKKITTKEIVGVFNKKWKAVTALSTRGYYGNGFATLIDRMGVRRILPFYGHGNGQFARVSEHEVIK